MTRAASAKSKRIAPPRAVNHARGLQSSTELTSWWYESVNKQAAGGKPAMQIKPSDVIDVLNKAHVRFVLMGAHAMAGWLQGDARATRDVDILVRKQHHKKAVQAIREAFPHLTVEDNPVVTRFTDPQINVVVIDLLKPKHDLHAAVFENTVSGGKTHEIPSLEMALATKFAAMTSPNRAQPRRYIDAGDFGNVVVANRDRIDREKLRELAELIYPGAGVDVLAMLDDFLAGRPIKF